MVTILKRSVISTVKIGGEFQNVSLLPLVFVVGDDGWRHSCPTTTREHNVLPSYNAIVEQKIDCHRKRRKYPFQIDEDITTMVQITSERESMDTDNNFTDEEKLRNQINKSGSEETKLLQNHQICEHLAVVDDTYNFLAMDKVPFIEVDGQQMSSWIDVKELLFPKCSEPNCCEVLNCLMKKFLSPSNLNLMHPCSEKEQKLFLRQFKLVFQGCVLVSLPEVKKRLDILQAEVEINHLEKSGKKACSYLKVTCSKCSPRRPKTSLPRQRNLCDRRPKSADKINSNERHLVSLYDRLAVVPILLVPDIIREPKQYGKSSQGPEADLEDIHFPVLLHYEQEKITVPCSIISHVFPQSYNVLLHCLLTTTNNQQEQHTFSACSSHQAFSFNRWIRKFLKVKDHPTESDSYSSVRGITTGSLLVNLEKFSELTYDLLPLSTRGILQSKCRWPDLTEEGFKNIIIWDNRPCPLLKDVGDSTYQGNADYTSLVSDSNYNAGKATPEKDDDVLRDQRDQLQSDSSEENAINGIEFIQNKVYDPYETKPYLPVRTRRKGALRVRPVSKSQPTVDLGANSSLSVSASQISSNKTLQVKSGRKSSKSGLAKSPYLSQPAVVKYGAFFSKRLQIAKSKCRSVRPISQVTDAVFRKPEHWSKAFIVTPPSVLRVKSPTKDIRVSTPRKPEESTTSTSEGIVIQCSHINTVVDTCCIIPCNSILTVNENDRNKSKPGKRHVKGNDAVALQNDCCVMSDIDPPFTTAVLLAKGINLQATPQPRKCPPTLQENVCIITDNTSITISSSDVERLQSNMTEENRERREDVLTFDEKGQESPDNKSIVFQPVPSWQQLHLQLDPKHPYDDLHKMYQLPPLSTIPTACKSSTNVPDVDISMSSSSLYTMSGSNSVACSIQGKDKMYPLTVDTSSTTLSPTNSSSVYSSDATNIPEPETPSQTEVVSESTPLKVDGLIEVLKTIQASAPKSKLENILAGHDKCVEEEKTVIDLASEVMKSKIIQNQPASPPRHISTALEMLLDKEIPQNYSQDSSPSDDICVCVPSITNCDLPLERNTNRQYIQIINNPCKPAYTRQIARKSLYKGSTLKLTNESANNQTLQNGQRKSKFIENTRSFLTPDLLNISRFQSLGNVLVTNSTSDSIVPGKSVKMGRKDDCGTTLQSDAKVSEEKRVEHIKINSSIPLRQQCDDQLHTQKTESERVSSCTKQVPTTPDDFIAHSKDSSVPSLDLRNLTEAVSRRSVRVQYDIKPSKSFGTGHFLHNKMSAKMKGINVRHTMPIAKNQFKSTLKKSSPKVFEEILTNKSSFRKPSFQNYLSTIPSEKDYHIPQSSPNVTYRSNNYNGLSGNHTHTKQYQSCPGCKNELNISNVEHKSNVSEQQQCDSSAPYKSGKVIRQRYIDGRISVISVHDSINNQLKVQDVNHVRNNCSLNPKRNQASIPLKYMNRLEDNLSVISLCSSREQNLYNRKRTANKSARSDDRKTASVVQNKTELNLSKDELPVARESVDPNTSSNVINVIFKYEPKHTRTTNDSGTVMKSRHDNAAILAKSSDKSSSHFKQNSRNTHQKLRICIDLVGSSAEDSPLEIKKLI